MQNALKLIIRSDTNRIYSLHIMNAIEYQKGKYVGLFLYYDDNNINDALKNIRHRLLFENSIEAIKDKVVEYASGRGENIMFIESPNSPIAA